MAQLQQEDRTPAHHRFRLRGMGTALITPFTETMDIDFDALGRLIDFQIDNGVDYLVVLATTGESATLYDDEKRQVMEYVRQLVAGRVPLVLGFGGNHTDAIVRKLKSVNLEGFSAILSVVPYYNKPSQEGLYWHYKAIAEASPVPVILYNVPGRTGVNMSAETTLRLAHDFSNIIGIKEASGNFRQIEEIIKQKPADFEVVSGDDGITYPLISLGAVGVISVISNAFPKEFGKMVRLCLDDEYEDALKIHFRFTELFNLMFVDGNPAGVKCALNAMGIVENRLRLPLVPTRLSTNEKIHRIIETIKNHG